MTEEEVKDKREVVKETQKKHSTLYYYPILCIGLFSVVMWLGYEFKLLTNLYEMLTIIVTFALVIFTEMEAYSTLRQIEFQEKRINIEDARNELEKAYGTLYTILNYRARYDEEMKTLRVRKSDFEMIDHIISKYPYMFLDEINKLWTVDIRPSIETFYTKEIKRGQEEPLYNVPVEFKNKLNEEYGNRVKRYEELKKK